MNIPVYFTRKQSVISQKILTSHEFYHIQMTNLSQTNLIRMTDLIVIILRWTGNRTILGVAESRDIGRGVAVLQDGCV